MDVAVAGVEDVGDAQAMLLGRRRWIAAGCRGSLRARHDAVLRAVARRQPADGAERVLAALPEQPRARRRRARRGPRARRAARQTAATRVGLRVEPGRQAVDLDDQHRAGVEREAEVERRLDRLEDQLVHHLQRRRDDAGADDVADRVRSRRRPTRRRRAACGTPPGSRMSRTVTSRDDAERALGADDDAGQVVARAVLDRRRRAARPRPSGSTSSTPSTWLTVTPYLSVCGPPELVGDVAADGARRLARRVGRVVEPVRA